MKKLILCILIIFIGFSGKSQTFTQTFIDKCTGEVKVATTTYVSGNAFVSFYNQSRTFTPLEVQTGQLQLWLQTTYATYNSMACPTNQVVQQTIQNTVTQAASTAASNAASSAASNAASSAASSSSSAASSTASSASSSGASSTSSSSSSSSSESKSETKSETKSESKSESKSEEKKEETKSESKEEKKEEKKSEEKKDKKEDKKEKKKSGVLNPMLIASDYTVAQNADKSFGSMLGLGWSKSSLMGDESISANAIIWSNLKQFALGGGYTKMEFNEGKLDAIHSYGVTTAYLDGNYMALVGYTFIKPHPKFGTYGYNVGVVNLFLKGDKPKFTYSMITSGVAFWTKPYSYSKKLTLSPQVFFMTSPLAYNTLTGGTVVGRHAGFLLGSSFDYKISKRFGFGFNYKINTSTQPNTPILHMFLIGSRVML